MTIAPFHQGTRFFTISTAGHVDHGKTSLIKRLTGIDPDRLKEEKERQMTTDIGFAYLGLSDNMVVGFVDVPGHGKFLKNMLAGVGGIDLALLVVAADEGPMPQTRQHVRILSLLGITRAVAAITKIDMVDEEQAEIVKEEVESLLKEHSIELLDAIFVSSTQGVGFDELKKTFSKVLSDFPLRDGSGALFLPVDRVFSKSGFGTVITGTLVHGKLAPGDQVLIEPGEIGARVRRLETHGQTVNQALPGQRVACNLVVKDQEKIARGHVLSSSSANPSKSLLVTLFDRPRSLQDPMSERLSDQPIRLYHGTAEYHGYLRWVEDQPASETRNESEAVAFLALQDAAVIAAQDKFVIRLTDDTIYGGTILLRDRPRWLTKRELLSVAEMLRAENFEGALLSYLKGAPQSMVREAGLSSLVPDALRAELLNQLKQSGKVVTLGSEFVLAAESRAELVEDIRAQLRSALDKMEDSSEGVTLEALRMLMHTKLERAAFQILIDEESARSTLIRKGDKVFLPGEGGKKTLAPALAALEEKVRQQLDAHWCLEWDELAELTAGDLKNVKTVVQLMAKNGDVIVASYDFIASTTRVKEAHQILGEIWTAKRSIAPTDFREKLGTTRKYAMALLQYFDDQKITRRLDSGRVLLKGPSR